MAYSILISPTAVRDLQAAIEYYNEKSENLGFRFADLVEKYFEMIASVPTASSLRYKNIRCKPMLTFPYLIMYIADEATERIQILRIFNTYQEPLW
ncbi:MAG: type II toxin-antitoxin system RelE/ParE family toxin [Bacteroidetes bacterium]|nr:type II toxin-antitoxin system RelE/ParE family toxin [Bacteroidota bacterium]MBS1634154.1 type II toxin-antitoxin system RelE/ParE family toxin [Bacteroidota bacterium]